MSLPESSGAPPKASRLLLKTRTHLVPEESYQHKISFLQNIVCNRYFGRNFDKKCDRYHIQGNDFAYRDRPCYVLIDHGDKDTAAEDVVLCRYKWTGEELVAVGGALPQRMQAKLDEYPFSGRPWKPLTSLAENKRIGIVIRSKIRLGMDITENDVKCLRNYPDEQEMIQRKEALNPRLAHVEKLLAESEQNDVDIHDIS